MTSNVSITEKNEKRYVKLPLSIPGTQGAFSDKVVPDIDDFTDESDVQCNVKVVKITSSDDSK